MGMYVTLCSSLSLFKNFRGGAVGKYINVKIINKMKCLTFRKHLQRYPHLIACVLMMTFLASTEKCQHQRHSTLKMILPLQWGLKVTTSEFGRIQVEYDRLSSSSWKGFGERDCKRTRLWTSLATHHNYPSENQWHYFQHPCWRQTYWEDFKVSMETSTIDDIVGHSGLNLSGCLYHCVC